LGGGVERSPTGDVLCGTPAADCVISLSQHNTERVGQLVAWHEVVGRRGKR